MIRTKVVLGLVLALTGLCLISAPSAFASTVTCPDGAEISVDAGADAFVIRSLCANHQLPSVPPAAQPVGNSDDAETGGTWVYDGPVCDNVGICASTLLCADGTPMTKYYFEHADGTRGQTQTYCPGDADIPTVPEVTPPSPGQIFKAFKSVVPPTAELSVQPPGGQTLVNFDTIFSTKAEPFTTGEIALVPGFKVVFEIFPTAFTWKFGDGQELKTDWAGKPWSEGVDVSTLITHAYTSKKDVKASVSITWGAKASLNGGEPVPVDGTVSVASAIVPLEVLEAVPQLVE